MILSSVILVDYKRRDLPISHHLAKKVLAIYHQEDVRAYKSVHVVCYANPNPTELFMRLATLFVTGNLVFGSVCFLGLVPRRVTPRNLLE